MTDWLPTLLSAAGSTTKLNGIDGINQWSALLHNYKTGPRKEMLYNIDPGKAGTNLINAGIRHKEMKLLVGDPGKPDGWIPPDAYENEFKEDHDSGRSANGEEIRNRKTF